MSIHDQMIKEKGDLKKVEFITKKLESYGIENVSKYYIVNFIDTYFDKTMSLQENYKNIVKHIIISRIAQRRRQILVHSCIYYHFNTTVISDHDYDRISIDLIQLQHRFPNLSKEAPLYKIFEDWAIGGTTSGFDLPFDNPKVVERAERILKLNEWYKQNG